MLLNGYSAAATDWEPTFLAGLAEHFTVICPDHRGIGASERGTEPLSIAGMARDVERLLDARGLEHAAIAGWSMGGFVAQELASRAPERVEALVLLGTDPGGDRAVRARAEVWNQLLDHSGTPRERASRLIPLLFPPALAPTVDQLFGDQIAAAQAALDLATVDAQAAAMRDWHSGTTPGPDDRVRTLILAGALDEVIPVDNADLLAARWPRSEIEVLAEAAHAFMAQEPARCVEVMAEFLRGR